MEIRNKFSSLINATEHRYHYVAINLSDNVKIRVGVPQDFVLGPKLSFVNVLYIKI